MQPTAWTFDVPNSGGTYTAHLTYNRPMPIGRVNIEPLYTMAEIDKATAGLMTVAKAFVADYEQNEEEEWSPEWQELADRFRAAIAKAEASNV